MIDFLKYRFMYALFSAAIMLSFAGLVAYKKVTRGQVFNYSVEFTGGAQILLGFSNPIKASDVISMIEKSGLHGITTREFSSREILVRTKETPADIASFGESVRQALQEQLTDNTVKVLQIDSIGEGIGAALSWNSIKAVILGLILMLMYIAWRFWSIAYGMGAVISLFHDAIVILLFFLVTDKEISMNVIAAIMTILGYSINDTIVIFARIRENLQQMRSNTIEKIVNLSINQTLRRTILTSSATALSVVALLVLGGEALRDLSIAILIGIVFGTYSSIYIASPVMLMLYKEK